VLLSRQPASTACLRRCLAARTGLEEPVLGGLLRRTGLEEPVLGALP